MAQLTRLYLDEPLRTGAALDLCGEKARYLGRVLRLRTGDQIHVFNGRDGEFAGELTAFAKRRVEVTIGECVVAPESAPAESPLRLHIVQGISRGERMDTVVQKTTELGIKRITPVFTRHGAVRLDAPRAAKRLEHWQRVAISATEQCGRLKPPLIDAPVDLNAWLGSSYEGQASTTQLLLDPRSDAAFTAERSPIMKLCLLIGPEGGFAKREIEDAEIAGFRTIGMGPRVLRTETAAIAAVAIAQALFGDFAA